MRITCWGSRGSIPVTGPEFIKYGGDTTCLEIRTRSGEVVIVDAGTGIRRLGNRLIHEAGNTYHFIITHAHWDHLMGYPFFKPIYLRESRFHMHRCPFPKMFMENMITKVMTPPNFPIRYSELRAQLVYEPGDPEAFSIGSMQVYPIPLSHPNQGSGYKFVEDGKVFVFLTDNELGYVHPGGRPFEDYLKFCTGADLLLHDAEYTPEEYEQQILWGHSSYTDALDLALTAHVKKFGLFHMNQERTDDEIEDILADCRERIAKTGSDMECCVVAADMVFEL